MTEFGSFAINTPKPVSKRTQQRRAAKIRARAALHVMSWPSFPDGTIQPISWAVCSCGTVWGFHPIHVDQARELHATHIAQITATETP